MDWDGWNSAVKFRAFELPRKNSNHDGIMQYISDFYWFEENGVHEIDEDGYAETGGWSGEFYITWKTDIEDDDGNPIYEGDIVSSYDEDKRVDERNPFIGEVRKVDGSWIIENKERTDGVYLFSEINRIAILGNKFENKNILTGGQ